MLILSSPISRNVLFILNFNFSYFLKCRFPLRLILEVLILSSVFRNVDFILNFNFSYFLKCRFPLHLFLEMLILSCFKKC